ncbi:carbamate kinase [Geomonas subterranea]|uniref:Carbamate kinase n=1 Tax=Geomonas subterranea TaxID=2847989 RepID=A0ABX8LPY3_9BACT|nr:carbamate kinase [Geomonas subterranea]QXE92654.1 carbamate kinase [Geomonas subterranea]QXM09247.1 carbamate kinase [Geomonas subterranea]
MPKPIAVVALGGNAILAANEDGSFETQLKNVKAACRQMLAILHKRYELVIVHGNGPQVGNLLLQFEKARDQIPVPPLDVAVASSQGLLGHMIEIGMRSVLEEDRLHKEVATIMTQVVVDEKDPAYQNPTKPIGPFFTQEEAERFRDKEGWAIVEDSGRGYRRTVCSPQPKKVLALNVIRQLAESGVIVVACGGGGIPVNYHTGEVMGTEGVIDKDFAASLLAYNLGAELFVVLTGVPKVALDFGKPTQRSIDLMTATEAKQWLADGQFPPGSMGPKIEASIEYLTHGGKEVIITTEKGIVDAMENGNCTRIVSC